jgi:hypothetical protein
MPIHVRFNAQRQVEIVEGDAPYKISTDERITKTLLKKHKPARLKPNPIQTALRYDKLRKGLSNPTMEEVAKHVGVSRVRVCQMLNLLKLDQRIVDYVANITNPKENNFWTERRLRNLISFSKSHQLFEFKKSLKNAINFTASFNLRQNS